ncbi:PadR family transcriptional regulator [Rathayibacter sp. VKM Ac-2803]|uniref:PadR family transcriptional regulator n=1 Tax=unclassified Rathayibacter TaxID=2609250 RepID=UPI00135AFF1D|nr:MULTISPECIES: helix-turn-helix transcriptional regulator [unclassified Rathayibacter]MWV48909.1 PadR family transcriptional regulator [Rathayibacter sp. VKM Ac-2803]MWV58599.1 PadR family transcriptional regulator [Rathayibacter sp. VKM Ac-2754]
MTPLARITAATADVLRVLLDSDAPTWGMLVIKATGRPAGSVYPILERLEGAGWVTSVWESDSERSGPRRRLYELTGEGAEAAPAAIARAAAPARAVGTAGVTA